MQSTFQTLVCYRSSQSGVAPAGLPPHSKFASCVLTLLLFALAAFGAEDAKLVKQEQATLKKIAAEWVKLGNWCVSKGLATQAKQCADRAQAVDSSVSGYSKLRAAADKCEDSAKDDDLKSWEIRYGATCKTIAGIYAQLFNAAAKNVAPRAAGQKDPKVRERFDGYFLAALELAPNDRRWSAALTLVIESAKKGDFDRAGRIAERALALNPPEKAAAQFKTALDSAAENRVILKGASSHPISGKNDCKALTDWY